MPNEVNIYEPRYLAEVVKTTPPARTFLRDTFFGNTQMFPTEQVDLDIVKRGRKMAAFVHPAAGPQIVEMGGYETNTYKAPQLNPAIMTTADDLMARMPGEDLYSGQTPAQRAAMRLREEYTVLDDYISRREEWMCAQALLTGEIPILGAGLKGKITFGFTNLVKLEGTKKWDGTAAKPVEDMRAWKRQVSRTGLANANVCIMGAKALDLFLANADVHRNLDNRAYDYGNIAPQELPDGVTYYGHLTDPELFLYAYDEQYTDDWTKPGTDTELPLIPENAVLLLPRNANYKRKYGVVTYIDDRTKRWVSSMAPRVLRDYIGHGPDRHMLEGISRPLMVPDRADSWLSATVC